MIGGGASVGRHSTGGRDASDAHPAFSRDDVDDDVAAGDLSAMAAERGVALVIGKRHQNVTPLKNPVNDAKLMAETLKSVGFELVGGEP